MAKDRTGNLLPRLPNAEFSTVCNYLSAVAQDDAGEFTTATRKRAVEAMRRITIVKSDFDSASFLEAKKAIGKPVEAAAD